MERPRKVRRSVATASDVAELRKHYQFVPSGATRAAAASVNNNEKKGPSTWQERMVRRYHDHLYKDYVLADLTRAKEEMLGLRWRTKEEVRAGRGSKTCGNKKCPQTVPHRAAAVDHHDDNDASVSSALLSEYLDEPIPDTEGEEVVRLGKIPAGLLPADFEVPFTYREQNQTKTELVKLRLCLRCAPLLFVSKGNHKDPCLEARRSRRNQLREPSTKHRHLQEPDEKKGRGGCGGGGGGGCGGRSSEPRQQKRARANELADRRVRKK